MKHQVRFAIIVLLTIIVILSVILYIHIGKTTETFADEDIYRKYDFFKLKAPTDQSKRTITKNISSVRDCAALCDNNPQCGAFIWVNDGTRIGQGYNHQCLQYPIGTVADGTQSNRGWSTFVKKSAPTPAPQAGSLETKYTKYSNTRPTSSSLSITDNIYSIDDCASLCDKNGQCGAFTWSTAGKRCVQYATKDPSQKSSSHTYVKNTSAPVQVPTPKPTATPVQVPASKPTPMQVPASKPTPIQVPPRI